MGLRDKVALVLIGAVFTQITLTHSFPSLSRKALKHYIENANQGKINALPKSPLPARGKLTKSVLSKNNNANINNDAVSKKSMYKIHNFPEIDYPLDNEPRDPFNLGLNKNSNAFERVDKGISQSEIINNLKKDIRMKRKLDRLTENEHQLKRESPSFTKYSSSFEPMWSKDQETFPQVEYPMTIMETWGPRYWNPSFAQNGEQNSNSDFTSFDPNASEKSTIFYKPKQQPKSKTTQYMEEIERLKEKMERATTHFTPTEETKGLNTNKGSQSSKNTRDLIKPDSNINNILLATNEPFKNEDDKSANTNTRIHKTTNDLTKLGLENLLTSNSSKTLHTKSILGEDNLKILNDVISNTDNLKPESTKSLQKDKEIVENINDSITTLPEEENLDELISPGPTKIPIPLALYSAPEFTTPKGESTDKGKQSHVEVPYRSVFVVPVGDSIREIQLPMVETNTGTPIIVIVPTTPNSDKPTIPAEKPPGITDDKVYDMSILDKHVPESFEEHITEVPPTDISNSGLLSDDCENLPINSMCHSSAESTSPSSIETYQDGQSAELFLEMLQPMIAITDTSSNKFPNIVNSSPEFISDLNDPQYLRENFSMPQSQDMLIPNIVSPTVTEALLNSPDITESLPSPVHEVFTSISDDNIDEVEDSIPLSNKNISSELMMENEELNPINDIHFFDMNDGSETFPENGIDIRDVSSSDTRKDDLPMTEDIALPIDKVIHMIKNGTLSPLNKFMDIPVKLPDGQLFYLTSGLQAADDEVVDLTKNKHMVPQAMELKDTLPYIETVDPDLVNELEPGTQMTSEEASQRSTTLLQLDKALTDLPTIKNIKEDSNIPLLIENEIPKIPTAIEANLSKEDLFTNIPESFLPIDDRKPQTSLSIINDEQSLTGDELTDSSLSHINNDEHNVAIIDMIKGDPKPEDEANDRPVAIKEPEFSLNENIENYHGKGMPETADNDNNDNENESIMDKILQESIITDESDESLKPLNIDSSKKLGPGKLATKDELPVDTFLINEQKLLNKDTSDSISLNSDNKGNEEGLDPVKKAILSTDTDLTTLTSAELIDLIKYLYVSV